MLKLIYYQIINSKIYIYCIFALFVELSERGPEAKWNREKGLGSERTTRREINPVARCATCQATAHECPFLLFLLLLSLIKY